MEEATPLQASPQASPAPARCCAACCRWLRCLAALLALAALGALQGFEYVRVARLEASLATAVARVAVLEEQTAEIEKIDHEERLTREEVDAELRRERQAVNRTMRRAELALAATADGVTQYAKDVEAQVGAQVAEVVASLDQYIITTQDQFAVENNIIVFNISGMFALLATLLTVRTSYQHLRHWHRAAVQQRVLVILWMVIVYATTSWLALVFPVADPWLGLVRDVYEAYCLYTFMAFMVAILGGADGGELADAHAGAVAALVRQDAPLVAPFAWPPRWAARACANAPAEDGGRPADAAGEAAHAGPKRERDAALFLRQCLLATGQFVVVKPVLALGKVGLESAWGGENSPRFVRGFTVFAGVASNASVGTAFYGLLSFFHAVEHELAWCGPMAKFYSVKGVIFLTFWQGMVITLLVHFGFHIRSRRMADQIQNFLICVEMFLASLVHTVAFAHDQWEPGYAERRAAAAAAGGAGAERISMADPLGVRKFIGDMSYAVAHDDDDDDGGGHGDEHGDEHDDGFADNGESGGREGAGAQYDSARVADLRRLAFNATSRSRGGA